MDIPINCVCIKVQPICELNHITALGRYYLPLTMYKGFENDSGELEKAETAEPITLSIKAPPSQHAFPNGGLAAWLNVIGRYAKLILDFFSITNYKIFYSMLICFCSLGFLQSFGVFQDFYTVCLI